MSKRSWYLVPLVLSALLALSSCDSAEQRAQKHFQSAVALLKSGDMARAKVEFLNVFKLKPDFPEARLTLAKALLGNGDVAGAYQQYLQVADQHPDNTTATLALAELAITNQQWNDAERYGKRLADMDVDPGRKAAVEDILAYRQAVMKSDQKARADQAQKLEALRAKGVHTEGLLLTLLDWYGYQKDENKLLDVASNLITVAPDNPRYYLMRMGILEKLGRNDEVVNDLKAGLEKFPDNKQMMSAYVGLQIQRGQIDDVEKFIRDRAAKPGLDAEHKDGLQVSLIQFLDKYRGKDVALAEVDKILKTTSNPDLFNALRAGILFTKGEKDAGIAAMQKIVENAKPSDQTRKIRVDLAKMLLAVGNKVGARAQIEEALSEDPAMVPALKMKAALLIDSDNADEAIVLLRHAQEQAPNDPQLATLLAKAYGRNGDRDLMENMLNLAVQYSGNAPKETVALAQLLMSQQKYLPAEDTLIQALRKQPDNLDLLRLLGQDYVLAGRFAEASGVITRLRAIGSDAANSAAVDLDVQSLRAQNRNTELSRLLENLSSDTKDSTRSALLTVRSRLARNDVAGAQETLDSALKETPDDPALLYARGVLESIQGHTDQARTNFKAVVAKQPAATKAWIALANTYEDSGDTADAIKVIDEGLDANKNSIPLSIKKAGILEKDGKIDQAVKIYESLYDENTSSVIMANNLASMLGSYYDDQQNLDRAYKIARRLRGLPQPAFQDTYGWIAFRRGNVDEALQSLEPAAAKLTADPLVQYHLGRVYQALGRFADAKAQYEKSQKILGAATNKGAPDLKQRLAEVTAKATAQE